MRLQDVHTGNTYKEKNTQEIFKVIGKGMYTENPMEGNLMVFYESCFPSATPYLVTPVDIFCEKFEETKPNGKECFLMTNWKNEMGKVQQCPQRQDATLDQLAVLYQVANRLGFYDAADAIRTWVENSKAKPRSQQPMIEITSL